MMLFEAKAIQREFNDDTAIDAELLIGVTLAVIAIFAIWINDSYSVAIVAISLLAFVIALAVPVRLLEIVLFVLLYTTCVIAIIEHIFGIAPLAWTGNINLVGYLAAILLIMALARRNATIILVSGFALAMVNCAGAILCVIAIVLYRYRHQRLVVAALLAVGLVVLAGNAGTSWMRLVIWNAVITSPGAALPYSVIHTHNAVLQMISSLGIIPAAIVTSISVCVLVMLVRLRGLEAVGAFVFVVISSMVDYIYWYPGIAAVVVCYLIWTVRSSCDYA